MVIWSYLQKYGDKRRKGDMHFFALKERRPRKIDTGSHTDNSGSGFPHFVILPILYYTATPVRITSR